jgi:hypothetical protein
MAFNLKEWLVTIGALAGIGSAGVEIAQAISAARADLTATYQQAPFALPLHLQEKGYLDTVTTDMYNTAKRLYYAYYERLTPSERQNLPDSLKRPELPRAFYYGNRVEPFARAYNSFGTLHIQNDGDKALTSLKVSHSQHAYYEYKDDKGHLQRGESAGLFAVEELVGGRSRDIKLWTSHGIGDENILTVTYTDGRTETPHTEVVSGIWAWMAKNAGFLKLVFYSLIFWAFMVLLASVIGKRKQKDLI